MLALIEISVKELRGEQVFPLFCIPIRALPVATRGTSTLKYVSIFTSNQNEVVEITVFHNLVELSKISIFYSPGMSGKGCKNYGAVFSREMLESLNLWAHCKYCTVPQCPLRFFVL